MATNSSSGKTTDPASQPYYIPPTDMAAVSGSPSLANGTSDAIAAAQAESSTGKMGTYGMELGMVLIFYDEMRKYWNGINPPTFDAGIITEVLGAGKYKVKLQCMNTVVTATTGEASFMKPKYIRGAYALVLVTPINKMYPGNGATYSIIAAKQTGIYAPDPSLYEV